MVVLIMKEIFMLYKAKQKKRENKILTTIIIVIINLSEYIGENNISSLSSSSSSSLSSSLLSSLSSINIEPNNNNIPLEFIKVIKKLVRTHSSLLKKIIIKK
jgi:hypothetical protein